MYNILVVEDTAVVRKILAKLIGANPFFRCVMCKDLAAAKEALNQGTTFLAAVVDLNLPDAPNGEVVSEVLGHKVPVVVLTGNFDESLRSRLLDRGVLDYITKDNRYAYGQVEKLLDRLRKNLETKVLVVDDSKMCLNIVTNLLQKAHFKVLRAADGLEALGILESNPDIKLVISDHHMPNMDGCTLVKTLRQKSEYQNLVFIGVSAEGDGLLSAKFIKSGANDFLKKPFYHEEFYWRVFSSLESVEMLEMIKQQANLDPLTGMFNRRYLFDKGETLFKTRESYEGFEVCIFDIDEFKQVNDTHGHLIGDQLLVQFSSIFKNHFGDDLVGRYGGEEFVVISTKDKISLHCDVLNFMNEVRTTLFTEKRMAVTCSVGICVDACDTLDHTLEAADTYLYQAKGAGRNRIEPLNSEVA